MTARALTFWDAERLAERERIRLILADALERYDGDDEKMRQFVHGMVVFNSPADQGLATPRTVTARRSPATGVGSQ